MKDQKYLSNKANGNVCDKKMGHCQWSIKCQILYMKRNYLLYGSVKIDVILLLYDAILQIIMHHSLSVLQKLMKQQ